MRSIPYTTEPVRGIVVLSKVSQVIVIVIYGISTISSLSITYSIELISSSIGIESTGSLRPRISRISMRHVLVLTNILHVVVVLELRLLQVQLTQNQVLHLCPCYSYAVTTVHVEVLIKVNGNLDILQYLSILSNAELDVTVADNLAISINEVDTNQRLAVDNLTSSSLTLDGSTIGVDRTGIEHTFLAFLDVSRLRSLLITQIVVNNAELILQTQFTHQGSRHNLILGAGTILSKAGIVEVSLDEFIQVDRTIVSYAVSSGHGDSAIAILIGAAIVTNALVEVVSANGTIVLAFNSVILAELGVTATDLSLGSVISQSNDIQHSRNNNTIVRSNGGVTLLQLQSNERQISILLNAINN